MLGRQESSQRQTLLKWIPPDPGRRVLCYVAGNDTLVEELRRRCGLVVRGNKDIFAHLAGARSNGLREESKSRGGRRKEPKVGERYGLIIVGEAVSKRFEGTGDPSIVSAFIKHLREQLDPGGAVIILREPSERGKFFGNRSQDSVLQRWWADTLQWSGMSVKCINVIPDLTEPRILFSDAGASLPVLHRTGAILRRQRGTMLVASLEGKGSIPECLFFAAANTRRLPLYRMACGVVRENDSTYFVKVADNVQSVNFLRQILHGEEIACRHLGCDYVVVQGELKEDRIIYPYYCWPTVEDRIRETMVEGGGRAATSMLDKYIERVDALATLKCRPGDFVRELGLRRGGDGPFRCFKFGPMDLIPANIMVNGETWYIVDHEWTFDFPVPRDFVVYRGIISLAQQLQGEIRSNVSKEMPTLLFSGYFRKKTYIPVAWLDYLETGEVGLEELVRWNWLLLKKILIRWKPVSLRVNRFRSRVSGDCRGR